MDMCRREFIAAGGAFAAWTGLAKNTTAGGHGDFIWAYMPQFGMNMWGDLVKKPERDGIMTRHLTDAEYDALCRPENQTREAIRFDDAVWNDLSGGLQASGCNLILADLGDFVVYPSHPELAIKGSWSAERMQAEVLRLKGLGFEVVPKLNFSCCHDAWLKEYRKMVSTAQYYRILRDLVSDAYEMFMHPKYVHVGMDEEDIYEYQARENSIVRMRQGDLWWHDLLFLVKEVEKHGARAWVWSDYLRRHTAEEFFRRMPKTVVQSPWTYRTESPSFDDPLIAIYKTLTDNGYDTVPCASNCYGLAKNFTATAAFCSENLDPRYYKGILFAPWMATTPVWRRLLLEGVEIFGRAVRGQGNGAA